MTYRSPATVCGQCDLGAFARCARCGVGQCLEHAVVHGARCPDCEHALHETMSSVRGWLWHGLGLFIAAPLLPLMVGPLQGAWRERMWVWGALPTGLALFEAALMTVLSGVAVGHVLVALRKRQVSQAFQSR